MQKKNILKLPINCSENKFEQMNMEIKQFYQNVYLFPKLWAYTHSYKLLGN